jgi:hypothetical protein
MGSGLSYFLAVLVGLGVVLWIGSRAGRTHRPVLPRFVRGAPIVAQGGLAGHASVVAAPKTSRVLAMIELKNALEEAIGTVLGAAPGAAAAARERDGRDGAGPQEALLAQLSERQLLDAQGLRTLKQVLLRLSTIETMVLSQRAAAMRSVPDREVLATAGVVQRLVAQVRERAASARPLEQRAVPDADAAAAVRRAS